VLQDQRTLNHLDWVHAQLTQAVAESPLREALVRVWYLRHAMTQAHGQQYVRLAQLVVMEQMVCQQRYPEWQATYACVDEVLSQVVRASSAVECVKSIVRMHQARHRHVSQGMLDLKRLYWNCRRFRHGKRKGRIGKTKHILSPALPERNPENTPGASQRRPLAAAAGS
jgi:hypothetical protein